MIMNFILFAKPQVVPHDLMFEVKEEQTKAPGYLTEAQLLGEIILSFK